MNVLEIISDAAIEPVSLETKFIHLKIDSLEFVQMITDIEHEYGVRFDDKRFGELVTVGDLVKMTEELCACR